MKSLCTILGSVGVFTLCVMACNDKDISLIDGNAGSGGSTGGTGGSAGSSGVSGSSGSGTGGSSGAAGGGGSAGGTSNGGSAGQSSAGAGNIEPPDGGTDSGADGPYTAICEAYCAAKTAWAPATGDAGVNCAGFNSAACQAECELEISGNVADPLNCAAYPGMIECHTSADDWFCQDNGVFANNCVATGIFGTPQPGCTTTCDTQAAAVNTCYGL